MATCSYHGYLMVREVYLLDVDELHRTLSLNQERRCTVAGHASANHERVSSCHEKEELERISSLL